MSYQIPYPTLTKNAKRHLFKGQFDLAEFKCIVCGKSILDTDIFARMSIATQTFRFIKYEEDLHVALCNQECEDLYRITPDEYTLQFGYP